MPVDLSICFQPVLSSLQLSVLSPTELVEYGKITHPKRRAEWFAGRVASKRAIQSLLSLDLHQIELLPASGQRPRTQFDSIHLSLSHTQDWAVSVASRKGPLGVDLEKVSGTDLDLMPISFSIFEQTWIHLEKWRFYQFWTAKEACLKALGLGLTVDLRDLEICAPLQGHEIKIKFRGEVYKVSTHWSWRYFWSICVPENRI